MSAIQTNLSSLAGPVENEVLAELAAGGPLDFDKIFAVYQTENVIPWGQGDLAATVKAAMESGQLSPSYIPGTQDCEAATGAGIAAANQNLQLVSTGTGLGLAAVGAATAAEVSAAGGAAAAAAAGGAAGAAAGVASVIPIIGPIIGAIIGLFALIFEHHAMAVKNEQDTLCAAVPAANNYLDIIRQAVEDGTSTPAVGIAALNSLGTDFQNAVGSIRKENTTTCNAACEMWQQLKAIIEVQSAVYEFQIANPSASSPVSSVVSSVEASISSALSTVSAGLDPAPPLAPIAGTAPAAIAAPAAASTTSPLLLLILAAIAVLALL